MQTHFDDIINKLDSNELWDFPGGIYPAERKELSNQQPIAQLPIAKQLFIPVKQHTGIEGHIIVEVGQHVLKGQALTKSTNPYAVPVHAPTSGVVSAIQPHVSPHPSGLPELTIIIDSDQQDAWAELTPFIDYQSHPKMDVLGKICDAGISGMGGAGFPVHIKLSTHKEVEFLIINGVECEPYITSDDRLMREHAWQIRQGIDVLTHLLSPKQVIIAIEHNKPEAIEAMQLACRENPLYKVCEIPTKYPSGGEKQLIQIVTNREVPAKGLPIDVGVISQNVGTCFAIADAIFSGKPLIQRVVTVTGEAMARPANYWALIGTPISHILDECQYQAEKQTETKVIMGGPMMGFAVANESVPVVKITNCILVPADKEIATLHEQACIRCGACADACPASLLPQQMFWHAKAKELDKVQEYNLFDCIECGACAYVCPSEIPLVHYYRVAKSEIRAEKQEKELADKARERFEKRAARLEADQKARDEKHRLAAEARKQAMASKGNDAKDKIAAALARAKAKKQALADTVNAPNADSETGNTETSGTTANTEQNSEIAEAPAEQKSASSNQRVQAAISRAKAKKAAAQAAKQQSEANQAKEIVEPEVKKSAVVSQSTADSLEIQAAEIVEQTKTTELNQQVVSIEPAPQEQVVTKQGLTQQVSSEQADTASQTSKEQQKQARIASAVAKAKRAAKNKNQEPQPQDAEQKTTPLSANEQIENKKRRIAAAVAKAKAKKLAEQALKNKSVNKGDN
ncbi:electron transport complex subunit RsxC [Paraglaciecola sp. L3A3]|uniref:electron transport complex subunit RsxC n=1 Tax=Paraglaciecola sp. L3A3 TaxID=2686358 RepID=UPI00131E4E74|nr:electron transport complex subunit RsxC [Paraglaciecola sp. L3A3]